MRQAPRTEPLTESPGAEAVEYDWRTAALGALSPVKRCAWDVRLVELEQDQRQIELRKEGLAVVLSPAGGYQFGVYRPAATRAVNVHIEWRMPLSSADWVILSEAVSEAALQLQRAGPPPARHTGDDARAAVLDWKTGTQLMQEPGLLSTGALSWSAKMSLSRQVPRVEIRKGDSLLVVSPQDDEWSPGAQQHRQYQLQISGKPLQLDWQGWADMQLAVAEAMAELEKQLAARETEAAGV